MLNVIVFLCGRKFQPNKLLTIISMFSVGGDRERMTSNHETYLLMASAQNDMEDWVKSIRRVIWAPFGGGELLQPVCQNKSLLVNGYKQAGHSLTLLTQPQLCYIL